MIGDALDAFAQIFSPPFRVVMAKTFGLTTAFLVLAGFGLDRLGVSLVHVGPGWLQTLISIALALGVIVGMILLAAPIASLVASFFLDDIAARVEGEIDPNGTPGRPIPFWPSTLMGMRFAVLSFLVSVVVLALTLLTGIGLFAFFLLNGYLLGREYFELAAMRHMSPLEARLLREEHGLETFLAGVMVAGFVAVPVLNLLTPLYATALMTRVYKRAARRG